MSTKLVYLAFASPRALTGVPEKICAWERALREVCEVTTLWVTPNDGSLPGAGQEGAQVIAPGTRIDELLSAVSSGTTLLGRVQRRLSILKPDVIYLRHPLYRPGLASILRSVAPYVMEINGNPYPELVLRGRRIIAIVDRAMGGGLFRGASAFVGVTSESIGYAMSWAQRPSVVIGNGVDCDEVSFVNHQVDGRQVHLAYIGSPSVYDGLDRLLAALSSRPSAANRVVIHLIGPSWDRDSRLSKVLDTQAIRTYGFVSPEGLPTILPFVDVGIGPLGLHRRGLREASNLKVRRYLAHGIPVVLSSDDPDLDGSLRFVLKLPANDQPLDVEALIEFAAEARNTETRRQARQFAEDNLSYRVKARRLVAFLNSLFSRPVVGGC